MASGWAAMRIGAAWALAVAAAGFAAQHCAAQAAGAAAAGDSGAQAVTVLGRPEVQLTGPWRYHAGDDPRWAQPGWPDASWQTIDPDSDDDKDSPVAPFAWVRRAVRFERSDPEQKLVLYVKAQDTYEVYWNGRKIGSEGEVPPRFNFPYHEARIFELPLGNAQAVSGVIAIRYWCRKPYSIGMNCGLFSTPYIGELHVEQDEIDGADARQITQVLALIGSGIPTLLAGLLALAAGLRRRDRILLLAGGLLISVASQNLIDGLPHVLPDNWGDGIYALANFVASVASLLLVASLLGILERPRLGRAIRILAAVVLAWGVIDGALCVFEAHVTHWMQVLDAISALKDFVAAPALVLVLVAGLRSPAWKRDWPFIGGVTLYGLMATAYDWGKQFHTVLGDRFDWIDQGFWVPVDKVQVNVSALEAVTWIMIVALLYTVVRHLAAERHKQERVQQELDAAREVQRVLVPESLPHVPGYSVESVYRPASEVGGDFFQVIPLASGRTLLAIGDVSGKGLRAAMIVSMIVGALRSISGFTEEPAEILAELNRRLCGRMGGGFATCIAARLEEPGTLTLANAGHLPPYVNGIEAELGGSLPLGLVESATYEQSTLAMAPGDAAVLLTDGICEAQDERQVLFGFARIESMLREGASPGDVATAAQKHGQNDDLTVLRVVRAV
ncbi:MAG: SpoIIE family protein phosphatase [Acidobacteriota bacterium]